MELKIRVHAEEGSYWAEVQELPGCFASGATLDELVEALSEAVSMYLKDDTPEKASSDKGVERPLPIRIDELKVQVLAAGPRVPA